MIDKLHNDYPDMDEDTREFTRKILFIELIETVSANRSAGTGPQTIKEIIRNDMSEFLRHQNYEACWLYSDTFKHFKKDIRKIDS